MMKINSKDKKTKEFWNGLDDEKDEKEKIYLRIGNNCTFLAVDKRLLFTAISIALFTL